MRLYVYFWDYSFVRHQQRTTFLVTCIYIILPKTALRQINHYSCQFNRSNYVDFLQFTLFAQLVPELTYHDSVNIGLSNGQIASFCWSQNEGKLAALYNVNLIVNAVLRWHESHEPFVRKVEDFCADQIFQILM